MEVKIQAKKDVPANWRVLERESGRVGEESPLSLSLKGGGQKGAYSNAQIDDHPILKRGDYLNKPPLHLKVKMRLLCDGDPKGTAGLGFWNDPFMMTDKKMPTLPKAIWFFWSSEESNMELALGKPGFGWKMGVMDAWRWPFLALIPTIPISIPLMWLKGVRNLLWPVAQKAMICEEEPCPVKITEWHEYEIKWFEKEVIFLIDGKERCRTSSPKGPLGLVIWIDNQYMRIDPRGVLKHGNIELEVDQSLEIDWIELKQLG